MTMNGEISVTLRNPTDKEPVNSKGTVWDSSKIGIMGEFFDESVQQGTPQPATNGGGSTPRPATRTVEIIRGSSVSQEKVRSAEQDQELSAVK